MHEASDITEELIVHDGFTTKLRRSGRADMPAIILIHGSGPGASGWSNWQYFLPELGDRFQCLAMDLSGYGGSPAPDRMPGGTAEWLAVWLAQVASLVRHLGLAKVHLVGNSMGGAIALHAAMRNAELFDRIALMGPVGVLCRLTREMDLIWGFYDAPPEELMRLSTQWFAYDPDFLGDRLARSRQPASRRRCSPISARPLPACSRPRASRPYRHSRCRMPVCDRSGIRCCLSTASRMLSCRWKPVCS
jgi:pimeloyl-ACP methyl ester carboxylesterase